MGIIPNAESLCTIISRPEEFGEAMQNDRNIALFMASWCGPCVRMIDNLTETPLVKEFLDGHNINALYVDVDLIAFKPFREGHYIHSVPHSLGYDHGERVGWIIGLVSKDRFVDDVKKWYGRGID